MRRPAPFNSLEFLFQTPPSAVRLRAIAVALGALASSIVGVAASVAVEVEHSLPRGVYRTEITADPPAPPASQQSPQTSRRRPLLLPPPPVEEVYVFQDSLDGYTLDDEGGWIHFDNSSGPTAWHIDPFQACTGNAWWCGVLDSSWVNDSNRRGYGNSWTQYLQNSVNLNGVGPGTPVTLTIRHRIKVEPNFDWGRIQILDPVEQWMTLAQFTGVQPAGAGCDSFSVALPESIWTKWNENPTGPVPTPFRFMFESDIAYSSEDGLYNGDGWIIDDIKITAGAEVKFQDDAESGMGSWTRTTLPSVGDYYQLESNVVTEDLCTDNRTNVWVDWDPVLLSLVPRLDNRLITPSVDIDRSSQVLVAFDVYRNLPLDACFYYSVNYRYRDIGQNWSAWEDPTGLLYYGSSKDWIRQKITLPEAAGKDSVEAMFIVKDYGPIYCGGTVGSANIYPLFDNVAIGIKANTPPIFIQRDLDLFNDTFKTTAFLGNDNFNTPEGDSTVIQVSTPRGYKTGFLFYRLNGGSWNSLPLQLVAPALPTYRFADVPPGNYPANTTLQYYFAVTDSADSVAYLPANAPTTQTFFSASILPLKSATNPVLGCTDSLATILFVNNNSGREPEPYIAKALAAQGFKFDTWDVNGPTSGAGNTPGGSPSGDPFFNWPASTTDDLLQYSTIIWHSGSLSQFTLRQPDQALMQSWVQQPGKNRNLYITGDNVAYELIVLGENYNSFLEFTAGARYLRNLWENTPQDSLHPLIVGYGGSPSAGRLYHANSDCPLIEDFDMVGISTSAQGRGKTGNFLKYPNNTAAATRFATKYVGFGSDSSRSLFMAHSFNAIEEGGERLRLIKNIMTDYFLVQNCYYPTAVEQDPVGGAPAIPDHLFQNAPNPFNPETSIRYSVSTPGTVTIRVYNVGGALVRTLVDRRDHPSGRYMVRWDGRDDSGRRLGSGVYFYKLETAWGATDSKKLIMLK